MKRRGVETVRRMCRDIIHSDQPALDLLSLDYIAPLFSFFFTFLSLIPLSLGHYYKQLRQLMAYRARLMHHSLGDIARLFSSTLSLKYRENNLYLVSILFLK